MPADSTTPTRQRERAVDEVLAQLGQHLLAQHLDDASARSGSAPSAATRKPASSQRRSGRRGRPSCPRSTASTRSPSSRGAASAGQRGQHVQRRARVQSSRGWRRASARDVAAHRARPSRDRAARSSRSSASPRSARSRVTTARYAGVGRRSRSRWVPSATTRPSRTNATWSTASSSSGLVVVTTVVRPARCARSRAAIRASVWASTALVGSTSTRISGSAASARASTSRCRWPPENDAAALGDRRCRGPSGSASRMSSADAVCERRARRRRAPRDVEPVAAAGPENSARAGVGDHDPARGRRARRSAVSGTPPSATSSSASAPAGRAGRRARRTPRAGRDTSAVSRPGADPQPGARRRPARRRRAARSRARSGSTTSGSSASTRHDAARRDAAADQLVGELGRGAQRDHQERRVAVERDQLAGADLALRRRTARRARRRAPRRRRAAAPGARRAPTAAGPPARRPRRIACDSRAVAVVEDLLAADAAQHPQPADDVGGGVGQRRPSSAAGAALRALQRLEQRADEQQQQRHADQHDQAERAPRCCSRITATSEERHDRAGEPGGHVHRVADVGRGRWCRSRPPRRWRPCAAACRRGAPPAGRRAARCGRPRSASW